MRVPGTWIIAASAAIAACAPEPEGPDWLRQFGYSQSSEHRIEIGEFGYPFVRLTIAGDTLWLPFDTGNMAGLTLASEHFNNLALPCSDEWDLLDSAGEVVSTGCTAHGVRATLFDTRYDSLRVLEFFHEVLPGLVGPGHLPGTRFTIDYRSGLLAADSLSTPPTVPGFTAIPLVRSPRHPRLILAMGQVEGRETLFEIDTGKSRTTVDRSLVGELSLDSVESGVQIGHVSLGPLEWSVRSARVVDTSGTSRGLPRRISLGVGSDVLRDFVFTVDYAAGLLWVEDPLDQNGAS
jgi:hypothetical protein